MRRPVTGKNRSFYTKKMGNSRAQKELYFKKKDSDMLGKIPHKLL